MKLRFQTIASLLLCATVSHLNADALVTTQHKNTTVIDVTVKKPEVEFISHLVYSQPKIYGYSNKPLEMDIMRPVTKELSPAVLFIPGGAFISSNKNKYFQTKLELAEAGYVVASIEYRLAPTVLFPEPLKDVKSAIRFLRANAKTFGIDPNRIAIMGNSAGGYLAAFSGVTNDMKEYDEGENLNQSSNVSAVIDLYGPSDVTKIGVGFSKEEENLHYSASSPESIWVNGLAGNNKTAAGILVNEERAKKANPLNFITQKTPPFLVMVGDKDIRVSPNQSEILHDALIEKGIDSTFYIIKGAGHGGPQWAQTEVSKILINFLDKNIKKASGVNVEKSSTKFVEQ